MQSSFNVFDNITKNLKTDYSTFKNDYISEYNEKNLFSNLNKKTTDFSAADAK